MADELDQDDQSNYFHAIRGGVDKETLLQLVAQVRRRAEGEDRDIAAQHEIIAALERKGLDATKAGTARQADFYTGIGLQEMERLLD